MLTCKVVRGLQLAEAVDWARHGFDTYDGYYAAFSWYRAHGLTPSTAEPYLRLFKSDEQLWYELDDDYLMAAFLEFPAAGIDTDPASLRRWGGLSANGVLEAVDRGFVDAAGYQPFECSDITAEAVGQLSELADDPEVVIGLWEATKLGISASDALLWIRSGIALSVAMSKSSLVARKSPRGGE